MTDCLRKPKGMFAILASARISPVCLFSGNRRLKVMWNEDRGADNGAARILRAGQFARLEMMLAPGGSKRAATRSVGTIAGQGDIHRPPGGPTAQLNEFCCIGAPPLRCGTSYLFNRHNTYLMNRIQAGGMNSTKQDFSPEQVGALSTEQQSAAACVMHQTT